MMRMVLVLLALLLPLTAAAASPAIEARAGFAEQRAAWNRGDVEGALDLYWNSPDLTWASAAGVSKGFKPFADGIRADFAGKPEAMGVYSGEVLEARSISEATGLLVVRWSIERDGRRIMGGVSTQLWEKVGQRWRIIFEHAS